MASSKAILLFICMISTVRAACDNQCSGHGTCGIDDVCTCYDNWGLGLSHDSGDCSERVCPYEIAWVDTPNKVGEFHKYAECAGRGICDRATGECGCFEGYEGKGCQRSSCPSDCSGHGTCEYIQDMSYDATWDENKLKKDLTNGDYTFDYNGEWDLNKIRGCKCDSLYHDIDCSKRLCPHGTDVLDTRLDLTDTLKYQVQNIILVPTTTNDDIRGATFALTFKSRLNETFTTIPIVYDASDLPDMTHDIQSALLNLPNKVIDGITVAGRIITTPDLGVAINVTFTGDSVHGPQHLLQVETYVCSDGCTPKLTGLDLNTKYNYGYYSNVTEITLADFNSYECGRRGKCDYSTGLCTCFSGYTGENCNTLTTLV